MHPKPVGIYVRVSRKGDREDERFHSPREQAERATALAVARGYVPGPVFEDIDVSGAKAPADRPAMGALLKEIKAGNLAGIAAFSLDRLSREPAHGDQLVRTVTKAGGVLLTPDMPEAIDSPTGEFTFGMLLQVARLYRAQAGARFATAKERAITAGIPVGPPPIGYTCDRQGTDRRLRLDPATATTVRELFERRAAGQGPTDLARFLDERTGHPWTVSGVVRVLRNHVYATGRLEYGPAGAKVVSEHAAEPIVDEALWHAAQSTAPKPRAPRSADAGWLLTGLVRCAGCGKSLSVKFSGPQSKYRRYYCRNRTCASRANVQAERLEAWVVRRSFQAGDELATRSEAPDLGALEDAATAAERRLAQVLSPDAQDALGDAWAATAKARRQERDAALAALGEARQATGPAARTLRLREVWDDLSPIDRRAALALYWKVIRVGRGSGGGTPLTFVARGPQEGEAEVVLPPS